MEKPQVFLLHFAGGNCYSFNPIASLLTDFNVIALELPGRGRRVGEALLKDFDLAATDIFAQIRGRLRSSTFLIYGHSLGSYLALNVARKLISVGIAPSYLIVSGNPGPGIESDIKKHLLGDEEFIESLKEMGGVPEEFIANKELIDFFMPILRADFKLSETNTVSEMPPISIPIYAIMGSEEEKIDKIANWSRFTNSRFDFEILKGNHFFIFNHPEKVAGIIRKCCATLSKQTIVCKK